MKDHLENNKLLSEDTCSDTVVALIQNPPLKRLEVKINFPKIEFKIPEFKIEFVLEDLWFTSPNFFRDTCKINYKNMLLNMKEVVDQEATVKATRERDQAVQQAVQELFLPPEISDQINSHIKNDPLTQYKLVPDDEPSTLQRILLSNIHPDFLWTTPQLVNVTTSESDIVGKIVELSNQQGYMYSNC